MCVRVCVCFFYYKVDCGGGEPVMVGLFAVDMDPPKSGGR